MIDPTFEEQYSARAAVPEHPRIFARWQRLSIDYRKTHRGRLNIPYGPGARETLDLFQVGGDRLHVFLHGGYWQAMEKGYFSFLAGGLAQRGIDVAICNYPLAPTADLDQILAAVSRACAFLWTNADQFGANWSSLQLSGHSAGGQLVAMLTGLDWSRIDPRLPPRLVERGIAISGLYDLGPLLQTSINAKLGLDAESARRNSPVFQVALTSVPLLLAVGSEERPAFHQQMLAFAKCRRTQGAPVETLCLPGLNHFTVVEQLARVEGALVSFLNQVGPDERNHSER